MKVRIIKENKLREGGAPGIAKKLSRLLRRIDFDQMEDTEDYDYLHEVIIALSEEQIFDESEWEAARDFLTSYLWEMRDVKKDIMHNQKMAKKWEEIAAEDKEREPSQIQGLKDYVQMFTDKAQKKEAFIKPMFEIVEILADNLTKYGLDKRVNLASLKNWVPWAFPNEEPIDEN